MTSMDGEGSILVTGACGHVGHTACEILRSTGHPILAVDVDAGLMKDVLLCDLTSTSEVSRLFDAHSVRTVIHLAGVLPSAFQSDPLRGADVNLSGSLALLRQATNAGVKRFVFASSAGVYGSSTTLRPLTESDPAAPDEPYGAAKRAIELVGESLTNRGALQFVALRIARLVGPGTRKTSSPWRSQIFELSRQAPIRIPFSPEARLSLVHVKDVARMILTLLDSSTTNSTIYNTPAETWTAQQLKQVVEELSGTCVELPQAGVEGGPTLDGGRFTREFGFRSRGLRDHLSDGIRSTEKS
jgi:UDP-glucose 4-epimerase